MATFLIFAVFVFALVIYGAYWKLFKEHAITRSDPLKPHLTVNVVGTAYDNDDGTSQQEILKHSKVGEKIILTHSPVSQDVNAVKVVRSNGKQVGWLHRSTAKMVASILDCGRKVDAEIEEISGGGLPPPPTAFCEGRQI